MSKSLLPLPSNCLAGVLYVYNNLLWLFATKIYTYCTSIYECQSLAWTLVKISCYIWDTSNYVETVTSRTYWAMVEVLIVQYIDIQWSPSLTDTIGNQNFVRNTEVSLTKGLPVYFRYAWYV